MSGFVFQYGYPAGSDSVFLFGKKIGAINSWKHLSYPIDLELDLNWHHYVMTKSGNDITIYFDGSLIESSGDGINFGTYRLNIGRDSIMPIITIAHLMGKLMNSASTTKP